MPVPQLSTSRLLLRAFIPEDAPAVQRHCGRVEIARTTLLIPHPYPEGMAEAWIASHEQDWLTGEGATWAVTEREEGAVVGAIGLVIDPDHRRAELGYWIAVEWWNRGYATEAARAVLAFGFRSLGLHRIHAGHYPFNPASGRVLQHLGMRREGVLRGHYLKDGTFVDLVVYAVIADEWGGAP
jgi:RimJ/RimL family protein N-acetyltransferase